MIVSFAPPIYYYLKVLIPLAHTIKEKAKSGIDLRPEWLCSANGTALHEVIDAQLAEKLVTSFALESAPWWYFHAHGTLKILIWKCTRRFNGLFVLKKNIIVYTVQQPQVNN